MSDIILIPFVALVGFVVGAAWMYRIATQAIDEYAGCYPRLHDRTGRPQFPTDDE